MKVKEITAFFEKLAPPGYQESYDNSGLQVGEYTMEVTGALLSLDVTEEVVKEAAEKGLNLIISHHPVIFGGLKSITGRNMAERVVLAAIRHGIAIYSAHTNLDAVMEGVNGMIARKIGLTATKILEPVKGSLKKLVVFVPADHADRVRDAIFEGGGGVIGAYDHCSFNLNGTGTFRAGDDTHPFVGEKGKLHREAEVRIETIFPEHVRGSVITSMLQAHPYEEVAYDIYPLENKYTGVGMGMIGVLEHSLDEEAFLALLRERFSTGCIKHTPLSGRKIKKVAVCGGAGSSLLGSAISRGADVFVSGDFKYHQFFDAGDRILIADIGHYESEQFTPLIFYDSLIKNFPKFAVQLSEVNTNPIKYF